MYQVVIKGSYEVEDADTFVKEIEKVASENKANLIGKIAVYQMAPYIDYQQIDAT